MMAVMVKEETVMVEMITVSEAMVAVKEAMVLPKCTRMTKSMPHCKMWTAA
jgi:hypothetical protein